MYVLESIKIRESYKVEEDNTTSKLIGKLIQYTFQFSFDITGYEPKSLRTSARSQYDEETR